MESDTPQGVVTGPSPENPTLSPMPQNPFRKKWWQLPHTVYIIIAAVLIVSLGSTAYLFLAPTGIFKPKPSTTPLSQNAAIEAMYGPSITPSPNPTSGVILVDGPTSTPAVIGSPTPTPDVTVGWLSFKNNVYGYSFKYPGDWAVTDLGNLEPLIPSSLTINPASTATPASALSITISSSTRTYAQEVALRSSNSTKVTINGLPASLTQEQNSGGSVWYDVVVQGKNYTYILSGKSAYASIFTPFYTTFRLL